MPTWSQLYSSLENYFTWLVSSFSLLGTMSSIVSHARFHPRSPPIECFTIPCLFVLTLENTKEGFVVIFVCSLKMDYFVIYVQALASDNGVWSKRKVYKKIIWILLKYTLCDKLTIFPTIIIQNSHIKRRKKKGLSCLKIIRIKIQRVRKN